MAIGVLKCLHEHQLIVPDNVAVASIDNLDISKYTIPSLTTVDIPKHQMGFHVADILTSNDPWKGNVAYAITVPTQLIVRESSSQKPD